MANSIPNPAIPENVVTLEGQSAGGIVEHIVEHIEETHKPPVIKMPSVTKTLKRKPLLTTKDLSKTGDLYEQVLNDILHPHVNCNGMSDEIHYTHIDTHAYNILFSLLTPLEYPDSVLSKVETLLEECVEAVPLKYKAQFYDKLSDNQNKRLMEGF